MSYLLDANVLMAAKRLHYGFDFCPAFWDWLVQQNETGTVFSIQRVGIEVNTGADELSDWAAARGPAFFLPPDSAMLASFGQVSTWAMGQSYTPRAVELFSQGADSYLVAHALAHRMTVVTHEKPENSKNIVKIPNACVAHGVACVNPFEMLRRERARFVLGASA
ncbi:MAG TPA: DUF4411 family protein [Planctomycetota bacterium]|nr:DUF4411 family protein [Planctomycetota bacterium]